MNEQIQDVLLRDIGMTKDRKSINTPSEICEWVNICLTASYSAIAVSKSLKSLGWQSARSPIKRGKIACRYYYKELDGSISFAYLKLNDEIGTRMDSVPHQATHADPEIESLKQVDFTYQQARRDKERALANTRKIETRTASVRSDHIAIQLAIERKEYIAVADAVREWETSLNFLKQTLMLLPNKLSGRFAGETDDKKINDEFTDELDRMCNRLADAKDGALGENQDDIYDTSDRITEVDNGTG